MSEQPRRKISIEFERYEPPPEPPPMVCPLCERERSGWQFRWFEIETPFCLDCRLAVRRQTAARVRWTLADYDRHFLEDADAVLHALKKEIKHGPLQCSAVVV